MTELNYIWSSGEAARVPFPTCHVRVDDEPRPLCGARFYHHLTAQEKPEQLQLCRTCYKIARKRKLIWEDGDASRNTEAFKKAIVGVDSGAVAILGVAAGVHLKEGDICIVASDHAALLAAWRRMRLGFSLRSEGISHVAVVQRSATHRVT